MDDQGEGMARAISEEEQEEARLLNQEIASMGESCNEASLKIIVELSGDIELIEDATAPGALPNYLTVYTTIENMTDKNEIDILIESAPAGSRFYQNRAAARELVTCLERWLAEKLITRQHQLVDVLKILDKEREKNTWI